MGVFIFLLPLAKNPFYHMPCYLAFNSKSKYTSHFKNRNEDGGMGRCIPRSEP